MSNYKEMEVGWGGVLGDYLMHIKKSHSKVKTDI